MFGNYLPKPVRTHIKSKFLKFSFKLFNLNFPFNDGHIHFPPHVHVLYIFLCIRLKQTR